jgi:hypothetical protein
VNRSIRLSLAILVLLLSGAAPGVARAAGDGALRRFALVIGANDGGPDRVRLRYATTDANAVARVVRELGGVAPGDLDLLLDPGSQALDAGFSAMQRKLAAARQARVRIELLVYYSGHSDEEGLLLGGGRYSYARLREQIRAMPADVHIAILDSCSSGAFTRTKGGTRRPAFLIDSANQVRGHAFLSSSSADEAAQESDRIGASFFTHYLVSGLRGGADRNRDGRVTLNEAYQFAFEETVSRTATTKHGTQHPAYDMHLAGTGDVVMTDLRATHAALVLAAEIDGRVLIRNAEGRLVVELQKAAGAPMTLGLGPERYHVTLQRGTRHFQAMVDLGRGGQAMLTEAALQAAAPELAVARGAGAPGVSDTAGTAGASSEPEPLVWATFSLVPPLSVSSVRARHYFAFNLLAGTGSRLDGAEIGLLNVRTRGVRGLQLGGLGNSVADDVTAVQIGAAGNLVGGSVKGVQLGGVANVVGDDLEGIQITGGLGVAGGDARVVQVGGVGSVVGGDVRGLQIGGGLSAAGGDGRAIQLGGVGSFAGGDLRGAQVGGGANFTGGDVTGLQLGGVGSFAGGDLRGLQLGGGANFTGGGVTGLQLGGVGNVAAEVRGAQVAGGTNIGGDVQGLQLSVLNIGGDVEGLQLGVVNIARRVRGLQLGVLNVAGDVQGESIGVVSAVRNGYRAAEAWASDLMPLQAGIKLGGRHVYSLIAAGATVDVGYVGAGLGVHAPLGGRLYLDIDAASYELLPYDGSEAANDMLVQTRAMLGMELFSGVSVFGGASLNLAFAFEGPGEELSPLSRVLHEGDSVVLRMSPGVFAGVSLH